MNIISKILKYFIHRPFDRLIFYVAIKTNGKVYQLLFNLFSILKKIISTIQKLIGDFIIKNRVYMLMEMVLKKEKMNCCQII